MCSSSFWVTSFSTCSEVAPGYAASTSPWRMVMLGSSVRGMFSRAFTPTPTTMAVRMAVTMG